MSPIRRWLRNAALRAVHQFRARIDRYKLVSRRVVRTALLQDAGVLAAMREHARTHGVSELEARVRVEAYVDEIVPYFNVLSYYRIGYNVARVLVHLLYRVSSEHRETEALNAIPRRDVVVYVMNHRSNADYVVVAYVLARQVSISYAVGEWARVWPLEYVFKSFGAYFVRRRYREPLYHAVLERYVQLITRNGVTQGIFPEGGLTRDGAFRPPKLGLLDYIARTTLDPAFGRDVWFVPVAINYDRVLEDRTLIHELLDERVRPGRVRQLMGVVHYVAMNLLRLLTGNLRRYGRVAVNFGAPVSLARWLAEADKRPDGPSDAGVGLLALPKDRRLPIVERLAAELMDRVAAIMPVTPVPLVAAALLSFDETAVRRDALLDRLDEYRDHLRDTGAKLLKSARPVETMLDRAWRMLKMRRLVVREGDCYIILPRHRPLLEYYANSIRHLLPGRERAPVMHPAREPDGDLPRLGRERGTGNGER